MKEKPVVGLFGFMYCATPQSCLAECGEKGEFWAPIPCYGFPSSSPGYIAVPRGDFCTVGVENVEREAI